MSYRIQYFSSAKAELDQACTDYCHEFRNAMHGWINQIAATAETDHGFSVDLEDILDDPGDEVAEQWRHALRKFEAAGWRDKIRALLYSIRNRRTPWQLRVTMRWFFVLDLFDCEVHAYYHVDHLAKRVVFVKFDGLPGQ